jgi:hypothetical protein
MEGSEMKNPFRPLIVEYFFSNLHFKEVFCTTTSKLLSEKMHEMYMVC